MKLLKTQCFGDHSAQTTGGVDHAWTWKLSTPSGGCQHNARRNVAHVAYWEKVLLLWGVVKWSWPGLVPSPCLSFSLRDGRGSGLAFQHVPFHVQIRCAAFLECSPDNHSICELFIPTLCYTRDLIYWAFVHRFHTRGGNIRNRKLHMHHKASWFSVLVDSPRNEHFCVRPRLAASRIYCK